MKLRTKLVIDYYFGGFLHSLLKIPTILLGKLLHRDHDLSKCSEIVILKPLGGGSLVIAYPDLLALRRLPTIKKLTLVTTPSIAPFGNLLGVFDEIIVIRDNKSPVVLALDAVRAIRKLFRCDVLIDLEIHSRLTTVFSLVTAARNRVGFFTNISFWRRNLSTHLLFCNSSNGIFHFYDQLAGMFGGMPVSPEECEREFRSRLGERRFDREAGLRIAIAPACSGLSQERMVRAEEWPKIVEPWAARPEAATGFEVSLLGAPVDFAELEKLRLLLEGHFGNKISVLNYAGKTNLRESVQILAAMDGALCIDSSLLHFSRLLGRRTVSFWGPTDPATLMRPNSRNLDEVHYTKLPCSPCVHVANQAPCKGNNICIQLAVNPAAPLPANQPWILIE